LVLSRICTFVKQGGDRCRNAPMPDDEFCFWHSPAHAVEAAEARRLGGLNRKKENTLQGVYDIEALDSVAGIRRILELAIYGAMATENSLNRSRVLIAGAMAAAKLLETGELASQIEAIRTVLEPRQQKPEPKRRWGFR
jgi:hypothetical protein